jgi:hypothetical protein
MRLAVVIALLIALFPLHARAEARIALLIGNQDYNPKVGRLKNPHDDVALVGADADYRAMDVAIRRFVTAAWTSGHCILRIFRVVRGGSCVDYPQFLRSANRIRYAPDIRLSFFGFRVGRTLTP